MTANGTTNFQTEDFQTEKFESQDFRPQDFEPEELWNAVMARDRRFDGRLVYAVRSTGIYCRPSCPSRRPGRGQVRFFAAPQEARNEGFRSCRRCLPDRDEPDRDHPNRYETDTNMATLACAWIEDYVEANEALPATQELRQGICDALGVGSSSLAREFKRETGLTLLQYARGKRAERFKRLLKEGTSVSDALYEAGYGSSSRVYEGTGEKMGMTPASYRKGGAGATIGYVVTQSSLGGLLLAATDRGVCAIKLGDDTAALIAELEQEFPAATLLPVETDADTHRFPGLRAWVDTALAYLDGRSAAVDLPLDVRATMFQWRVWRQLQAIPVGETRTYQQLAEELGAARASRAVGRACATNPVAPIVPCHRALRKDGGLAGYRWGLHRKEALLEMERRFADGKPT